MGLWKRWKNLFTCIASHRYWYCWYSLQTTQARARRSMQAKKAKEERRKAIRSIAARRKKKKEMKQVITTDYLFWINHPGLVWWNNGYVDSVELFAEKTGRREGKETSRDSASSYGSRYMHVVEICSCKAIVLLNFIMCIEFYSNLLVLTHFGVFIRVVCASFFGAPIPWLYF